MECQLYPPQKSTCSAYTDLNRFALNFPATCCRTCITVVNVLVLSSHFLKIIYQCSNANRFFFFFSYNPHQKSNPGLQPFSPTRWNNLVQIHKPHFCFESQWEEKQLFCCRFHSWGNGNRCEPSRLHSTHREHPVHG